MESHRLNHDIQDGLTGAARTRVGFDSISHAGDAELSQSRPWVGLTHGLVGLGRAEFFQFLHVGLG